MSSGPSLPECTTECTTHDTEELKRLRSDSPLPALEPEEFRFSSLIHTIYLPAFMHACSEGVAIPTVHITRRGDRPDPADAGSPVCDARVEWRRSSCWHCSVVRGVRCSRVRGSNWLHACSGAPKLNMSHWVGVFVARVGARCGILAGTLVATIGAISMGLAPSIYLLFAAQVLRG